MDQPPAAPAPEFAVPADAIAPEPRQKFPLWAKIVVPIAFVVAVVMVAGFVIHVPYTTISPGAAVPLNQLVRVEGARTYPENRGDFRLLYVRERDHVNVWRYIQAKLDSDTEILKDQDVNPSGEPQPDIAAQAQADMSSAKIAATKVALEAAGYTVKPSGEGILVLASLPSRPAGKVLQANDLIVASDGKRINTQQELSDVIGAHKGGKVPLTIQRDGKTMNVEVGVQTQDGKSTIGVIVIPPYSFPVKVSVDTSGIGGPSGGLAMTLAILDNLTPGDLSGGKRVAVTGTIDTDGHVGEIGGIEQKAVAARAAGVQMFLVPQCEKSDPPDALAACQKDLVRATDRVGKRVKVVPVSTFDQALQVLRENGGAPVTKTAPVAA